MTCYVVWLRATDRTIYRSSAAKYMTDLGSKSTVTYGAGGEIIVTTTSCYGQEDTLHALKTAESMPRSAFAKGCLKGMGWDDRSS